MKRTIWLPLLAVFTVLLAACGGDADVSSEEPEATSSPTEAPADDGGSDDGAADDCAADDSAVNDSGDDDSAADGAVELTASARGVTAATITLGIPITDVNVFAPTGDILSRFQPLVDATNAAGGINGRQIEIVTQSWDVLDGASFDAACTALTEDTEVFLVLGFLIDGFSNVPCYTELHETVVINTTGLESEDIVGAEGRLLTTRPDELVSLIAGLNELAPELDGAKVAVYSGAGDESPGIISDLLTELGAEVVAVTEQQIGGSEDLVAAEAEIETHIERWSSEGAEWVVNVGSGAGSLAGLGRAGLTDLFVVSANNLVPANTALGADLSVFPNLIATGPPNLDQLAVDGLYGVPECIDLVNDGTGQGIKPFPPEGEDDQVATTVEVCAAWDIFVALATAAGPNLTPETFLQAGYDLGEFPMTGSISGSVAPGKAFVSNAPGALFVYDAETDAFVER